MKLLYMVGWKRWFYNIAGWDYVSSNQEYNKRQKHLKYLLTEQIKKTKNIKKILKCNKIEDGEIVNIHIKKKYFKKKRRRNN